MVGGGDMGIANTTSASALFAALLPCPAEETTGRGTGIDEATLVRKIAVVEQALAVNRDRLTDPLATLAALGGLEIAGICGLVLGATAQRIPAVVDGFIELHEDLALEVFIFRRCFNDEFNPGEARDAVDWADLFENSVANDFGYFLFGNQAVEAFGDGFLLVLLTGLATGNTFCDASHTCCCFISN